MKKILVTLLVLLVVTGTVFGSGWVKIGGSDLLTGEHTQYVVSAPETTIGYVRYYDPIFAIGTLDGQLIPMVILGREVGIRGDVVRVSFDGGPIEEYGVLSTPSGFIIMDHSGFAKRMIDSEEVAIDIRMRNGHYIQGLWLLDGFVEMIDGM